MRYCYEIDDIPRIRFVSAMDQGQIEAFAVEAWGVKLMDYPQHDFFIHRPLNSSATWVFTEATTGMSVASDHKGKHPLIRETIERLARVDIDKAIASNLDRVTLIEAAYAAQSERAAK